MTFHFAIDLIWNKYLKAIEEQALDNRLPQSLNSVLMIYQLSSFFEIFSSSSPLNVSLKIFSSSDLSLDNCVGVRDNCISSKIQGISLINENGKRKIFQQKRLGEGAIGSEKLSNYPNLKAQ